MNFQDGQPIYVQIAERLSDEILAGTYAPESRVPGVREYSALLGVNVNTTVKAFDLLSQREVIYSKRGMGYFVAPNAPDLIREERKKNFISNVMPAFFRQMQQLGISIEEVVEAWKEKLTPPKDK